MTVLRAPASTTPRRRRRALLLLLPSVLLVHLWLVDRYAPQGFATGDASTRMVRIDVAFVRELRPAPPPSVMRTPPALRHALRPVRALAPLGAASAAPLAAAAGALSEAIPEAMLEVMPEAKLERLAEPLPAPLVAAQAAPAAAAEAPPAAQAEAQESALPAAASPAAASDPAFEWPPSTRLTYLLTGNYRGPVEGQARVDWLLTGQRYQVHLELSVGPSFAPLVARRMSSDGEVTADGLVPRRYEEETRVAFQQPRTVAMAFGAERVVLADGREVPRPGGVQDSASQFVQMTWLFTTRAGLLARGHKVEIPLALPRAVDLWTYDVLGEETVYTATGPVQAMHVKPRREARPGAALTAEFWVAPTLQYLPVRIVIRQDAQTWVDLLLERLPQQALR